VNNSVDRDRKGALMFYYLKKGWQSMTKAAKVFFILLVFVLTSSAISALTNNKETVDQADQVQQGQEINPEAYIKKNGFHKKVQDGDVTFYSVTERLSRDKLTIKAELITKLPKNEKIRDHCNFFGNNLQAAFAKKGPGIEVSLSNYAFIQSTGAGVCVYKYKQFDTVGTQIVYTNGNSKSVYSYIIIE
jgi:hypothetical protein